SVLMFTSTGMMVLRCCCSSVRFLGSRSQMSANRGIKTLGPQIARQRSPRNLPSGRSHALTCSQELQLPGTRRPFLEVPLALPDLGNELRERVDRGVKAQKALQHTGKEKRS